MARFFKGRLAKKRGRRAKWRNSEYMRLLHSARWKRLRQAVIERDGYRCQRPGCNRPGRLEVHHLVPYTAAPDRFFDPENCQTVCHACHWDLTERERGGPGAKFREAQAEYYEFAGLPPEQNGDSGKMPGGGLRSGNRGPGNPASS